MKLYVTTVNNICSHYLIFIMKKLHLRSCIGLEYFNMVHKNTQCNRAPPNLNVTDSLIISMIFIFLSCREKAHDNKEFSHENSKPIKSILALSEKLVEMKL